MYVYLIGLHVYECMSKNSTLRKTQLTNKKTSCDKQTFYDCIYDYIRKYYLQLIAFSTSKLPPVHCLNCKTAFEVVCLMF